MKPVLSEKAKAILLTVAERIVKYPETYEQSEWYWHDKSAPRGKYPKGLCGTVACIAGHVVIAAGVKKVLAINIDVRATEILGISNDQADQLFLSVGYWPNKFRTKWQKANTGTQRAEIAAARIHHFIETGK